MNCAIKRIIQIDVPISWNPIRIIDNNGIDVSETSLYSWSTDNICWTNWTNKKTFDEIGKTLQTDIFLRILIFGGFSELQINNLVTDCYHISLYNENPFAQSFCDNENLFQPYNNLDCALQLQQQMSDSIICMFGIPCYYFKVSAKENTADYTFKEYLLHSVEDVKVLKIMVQDGEMPSSNPQMSEFDFDWENEWEVEISKTAFARAFGDTAYPKNMDFIYVPLMKRMFDVNSAYDEKNEGLMWRSTTWKLMLQKYNENTNVDTDNFEDIIDNFIVNYHEDVFTKKALVEQERQTGTNQMESPLFASTNTVNLFLEDAVRESMTVTEKNNIVAVPVNNGTMIVARNFYNFANADSTIVYQNGYCGESGTISFIISPRFETSPFERQIISVKDLIIKYNQVSSGEPLVSFGPLSTKLEPTKIYLVICKWNRGTQTTSMEVYENKVDESIERWRIRPEMYKFDFVNKVYYSTGPYNNDYRTVETVPVIIRPYGCLFTNFKLYENYLNEEEAIKESLKYSTTNMSCVINDVARPLENGHGYVVR